jgi:hypothetical protein
MKTWWKERKYFKFPGMRFYACLWGVPFTYHKYPKHFWQKVVMFQYLPLQWKPKYDEFRFEQEPFIDLNLFGYHFGIVFSLEKYNLDAYWEALLEHLFTNKTIKECVDDNTWSKYDSEEKLNVYTQNMLTKKGRKEYEEG